MTKKGISEIKADLTPYIGTQIKLQANSGRKKIIERTGVLESTYPNLFIVRVEEKSVERKMSFSYVDLLTENVILTVNNEGKDEKLLVSKA